jgi:hypothetical protein
VISYERRSSAEYVSQPQPCSRDGEVGFGRSTDPIIVPSFILNFDSAKDKKLLSFALYDFSRRPKVERILEFDIPLGDYVDCMARQSFCEMRTFPFRSGKYNGELRVILRMYPVGEAVVPTMGLVQSTTVVRGDIIQAMRDEKLVPATVSELEGDADVLDELTAKVLMLKRARAAKKATNPALEGRCNRRAELELLLEELEAAERRDGGRSQLDSADRHMLELLEEEARSWQDAAAQFVSSNNSADDRNVSPPKTVSPTTADPGLLHELKEQKSQLKRHIEQLHGQQHRRDVTQEAIDTLDAIKHLDDVIEETTKAVQTSAATSGNSNSTHRRAVRFKEDADDTTPEGLALRLLHAHCDFESMEHSIRLLELLKNKPYDGFQSAVKEVEKVPISPQLQGIANNRRKGAPTPFAAARSVSQGASSGKTVDLLADLFATAPPPSVAQGRPIPSASPQGSSAVSTAQPARPVSSTIDDLFGDGPTPAKPAAQAPPAPSAPQVAAPSKTLPTPQVPDFEVLPIPTTTSPASFGQCRQISVRCQAVKFSDWTKTKFIRGAEVEFRNDGQSDVTLSNVNAFQEDIFTSTETPIPCKCNSSLFVVPSGGRTATVYLSFGPSMSMQNGIMALLRVTVENDQGTKFQDSVRATV